jgi:hypothetical protein
MDEYGEAIRALAECAADVLAVWATTPQERILIWCAVALLTSQEQAREVFASAEVAPPFYPF